jgi:hypothetical protein
MQKAAGMRGVYQLYGKAHDEVQQGEWFLR